MRPIVLAIAGSDPSAGAGIQGDLKAIEAVGAYAATVVTAITAQNTRGVRSVHVLPPAWVREQLQAVLEDMPVAAIKIGMLGDPEVVQTVGDAIDRHATIPLVLDPVLHATDGSELLSASAIPLLLDRLARRATLLTPNAMEAGALTGSEVRDLRDAERSGRLLVDRGVAAVLITGGHLVGSDRGTDLLVTPAGSRAFRGEWIANRHTHGAGCTMASAIAAFLAQGRPLEEAIESAKRLLEQAMRLAWPLGGGRGPTDPLAAFACESRRKTFQ